MIRVGLADDQALLRATFRLLIDSEPDMRVTGEASTGTEAIGLARRRDVDVIVMDIRMPERDGIEATRAITGDPALAEVKVLILTTFEDDDLVVAALRAGAAGFLGKGAEPAELLHAVRTVWEGSALLSPRATRALIGRVLEAPEPGPADARILERLTPREREIVGLVGAGESNDEIAAALVISPATVKTHVNRAMAKVGARDRAQLVVFAHDHRLVRHPR